MALIRIALVVLICLCWVAMFVEALTGTEHLSVYPRGCDQEAALQCEYDFLLCKLFGGPANDAPTLCRCAKEFYGSCLRLAGVSIFLHLIGSSFNLFTFLTVRNSQ